MRRVAHIPKRLNFGKLHHKVSLMDFLSNWIFMRYLDWTKLWLGLSWVPLQGDLASIAGCNSGWPKSCKLAKGTVNGHWSFKSVNLFVLELKGGKCSLAANISKADTLWGHHNNYPLETSSEWLMLSREAVFQNSASKYKREDDQS